MLETLRLGRLVGSHLGDIRSLWHAQLAIDSAQLPLWASSFRCVLICECMNASSIPTATCLPGVLVPAERWTNHIHLSTQQRSPLAGELLFISLVSALTAGVFLPAKRWSDSLSDIGGGGYPHVALEAELPARQKQWATNTVPMSTQSNSRYAAHGRMGGTTGVFSFPSNPNKRPILSHDTLTSRSMRGGSGSKGPPVFCLETACWLMEVAWQVGVQHRPRCRQKGYIY